MMHFTDHQAAFDAETFAQGSRGHLVAVRG